MNVLSQLRQTRNRVDQIVTETNGMRGSKPESFQALDFIHRFQQLYKGTFAIPLWKFVTAIQVYDLPEKGDFFHTMRDQVAHLSHDLIDGTASFCAARLRDDAKGAMHVAALHDGDERNGLPRHQLLITNRRLRAWFVRNIDDRRTQIIYRAIREMVGRDRSLLAVAVPRRLSRDQFFHVISHVMEFLGANNQ